MGFYLFLTSVIFISFSGVMTPGPLFVATVTKGLKNGIAGVLIALGHGIIEFPLMFLIYFGFAPFLASTLTQKIIGFVGGLIMIYMALRMIKAEKKTVEADNFAKSSALVAGIITTIANPYFLLWWATIGTTLIMDALVFGFFGFLIFAMTHWLCDLLWDSFIGVTVFKSKRFLTNRACLAIFGFCFVVFTGFGLWFIISALI
jgi:threonine/homoserine/homoserine lactone efflux protein